MRRTAKVLAFLLILAIPAFYQAGPQAKIPPASGYVSDFARVIKPEAKAALEGYAAELEAKTTAEVAVVTVGTVAPLTIEQYAVELFRKWGIGKKGKDNGVLLLVALEDRRVRIETGYGLEGAIPDAIASRVIQDYMIPFFKKGAFSEGILAGGMTVISLVAEEYGVSLEGFSQEYESVKPPKPSLLSSVLNFLFTVFVIVLFLSLRMGLLGWLLLMGTGRRRGGYWYGSGYGGNSGGFSGGFGGFGGGLSGGGGASGGW